MKTTGLIQYGKSYLVSKVIILPGFVLPMEESWGHSLGSCMMEFYKNSVYWRSNGHGVVNGYKNDGRSTTWIKTLPIHWCAKIPAACFQVISALWNLEIKRLVFNFWMPVTQRQGHLVTRQKTIPLSINWHLSKKEMTKWLKPHTKNKSTNKQNQPEREAQAFFLLRMVVSSTFFTFLWLDLSSGDWKKNVGWFWRSVSIVNQLLRILL